MDKNKGLKLDLQFFAEDFDPDNVLLQDVPTGIVPTQQGTGIVEDVVSQSAIMQLARAESLTAPRKEFQYMSGGIGSYWVDEGEVIQTARPQWLTATMQTYKLGVIVPVSKEFLRYSISNFFSQIRPIIAESFYTKFDMATIFGVDNPFPQSVLGSATDAGNVVTRTDDPLYSQINGLMGLIEDNELDPNGIATTRSLRQLLRGQMDEMGRPIFNQPTDGAVNSILGLPIGYVDGKSFDRNLAEIILGDWDYARYGILQGIEYAISQEATLTSVTGENGLPINLFERDLFALRATMHVGFMVLNDEAFAVMQPPTDAGGGA